MGFPKMLLEFNGRTMLGNVIDSIIGSDVNQILVVLGSEREAVKEIADRYGVRSCFNEDYSLGMLSSVQCGFRNLPEGHDAVIVFQGDQPLITTMTINSVISAYRSSGKGIVIPVHGEKRGHPILIDRRYRNEIDKLDQNIGLRSLTYKFSEDILEVTTDDPGILRDFDTYEEYREEINKFK